MINRLSELDAKNAKDAALAVNLQMFALASFFKGEVKVFDDVTKKPLTIGLGLSPDLELSDIEKPDRDEKGFPKLYCYVDPRLYWVFENPDHQFVKDTMAYCLCSLLGFFYELVKRCDTGTPSPHPVMDFFRHVRNAAFHGNSFQITSDTTYALWRNRSINQKLNGTRLFFDFLAPGDAYLLISDVLSICQMNHVNATTLMANRSRSN